MPPVNDDLANATLISGGGPHVLSGSNVGATAEAQEASELYPDNTTWYRIEITEDGTLPLRVTDATWAYYMEVYRPTNPNPADFSDVTDGFTYDSFIDSIHDGGGMGDGFLDLPVLAGEVYYLLVTDWLFDGSEGTFTLRALIPLTYTCDAAPGANLASGTVSIVDTDWVRDEQLRVIVPDVSFKGEMDYTKTFEVEVPDCVPAGDWKVELFIRFDDATDADTNSILVQMRQNGNPIGRSWGGGWGVVGDFGPEWVAVTHADYGRATDTATDGAGPHFVRLRTGDTLSFDIGIWDDEGNRVPEVQRVRFSAIDLDEVPGTYIPSWRKELNGDLGWDVANVEVIDNFRYHDGKVYGLLDIYAEHEPSSDDGSVALNIWSWSVNGSDITLDSDLPITGAFECISSTAPRSSLSADTSIGAHDFDVLPNGDIVAAWVEHRDPSGFFSRLYKVCASRYDAGSGTWSSISTDVWGHGEASRHAPYLSVEASPDGDHVFIAWSEADRNGIGIAYNSGIRCVRYDTSGGGLTELGTSAGSPLRAFATVGTPVSGTRNEDGDFDRHLRVRVSPAGVPWIAWPVPDPLEGTGGYEERAFAYFWNGSAWVDSQVPYPSITPHDGYIETSPSTDYGAGGSGAGNYINYAIYGFWYVDLTFCQHDGPSEHPSIAFQYAYFDSGFIWDVSGFAYFEYGGTPGSWGNELFFEPGRPALDLPAGFNPPFYDEFPSRMGRCDSTPPKRAQSGGWTQGMNLQNDGSTVYFLSQQGFGGSQADHPVVCKLKSDGSAFEGIGTGFADDETFPYSASLENKIGGGGWMDPTTNAGVLAGTIPVQIYRDTDAWLGSPVLVAFLPSGGTVSMNWRSADRNAGARRVLVGN